MKLLTLFMAASALTLAQPSFAGPQALKLDSPAVKKAVELFSGGAGKVQMDSQACPIVLPSDNKKAHKQLDRVLIMGGATAVPM